MTIGVLLVIPSLVATGLRLFPSTEDGPVLVSSFIPYAVPAYLAATLCFVVALVRARRRRTLAMLTAVSSFLLGCHLCWLAPLFVPDQRPPSTASFTLISLNTHQGGAAAADVYHWARTVDVVVLIEATPDEMSRLGALGWQVRFPYSVGKLVASGGVTMIYSRFPLSDPEAVSDHFMLPESSFQQWAATAAVPQLGPVRIIAAHPCNPYCGFHRFAVEHAQLRAAADANLARPLIIAGDLNATDDQGPIRDLRRDGLRSATDIVGAGWLPTYPADRSVWPLLPIDHVLVNRFLTATAISSLRVAGTDHLGLRVQIAGTAS